jgi:cytochrome c biogenesis protein CcdA
MIELLLVLVPIALVDSIGPVRVGLLVTLLGRDRPFASACTFIFGIFSSYFLFGFLISMGLDRFIDWLFPENPAPIDFGLSALIGLALLTLGLRNLVSPNLERPVDEPESDSLVSVFILSWVVTLATSPGAVPYLAGIDQILRADVSDLEAVLALAFYCAVYLLPLLVLLLLRSVLGEAGINLLRRINEIVDRFMPRVMAALFAILGVLLLIDAIGYFFFDRPLW